MGKAGKTATAGKKAARKPARKAAARTSVKAGRRGTVPHYNQTTGFTCGPSSLLMVMKALAPASDFSRAHELQLWREATTIFMGGPHHGGCGATGLALAAHRRGFQAEVWISHKGALLSTRPKERARTEVIEELDRADRKEMKRLGIPYKIGALDIDDLKRAIADGAMPIVLVNMEYIHQDPTAHWVVVTGVDDEHVTVNDPWISRNKGHTAKTVTDYAVPRSEFPAMTSYGKRKERATVLIRRG
ncbi:MAG TPA: peptidase C39 family protein [Dongiaceae bacterium]|nr:peptidase C39 family protein [Dongiaceae bacterium]